MTTPKRNNDEVSIHDLEQPLDLHHPFAPVDQHSELSAMVVNNKKNSSMVDSGRDEDVGENGIEHEASENISPVESKNQAKDESQLQVALFPARHCYTKAQIIKESLWICWVVLQQNIIIVCTFLTVIVLFYLPAFLINLDENDILYGILYKKLSSIMFNIFLYASYITCLTQIFGFRFTHKYLIPLGLSGMLLGICLYFFSPVKSTWMGYAQLTILMTFPYICLYLIKNQSLPDGLSDREDCKLIKDGTPVALLKGWTIFFMANYVLTYGTPIYIELDVLSKILTRLLVVPLFFFVVNFGQQMMLVGLSVEQMGKRLLVSTCTRQYLHFYGRVLISDIASDDISAEFIYINVGYCIMEIALRTSYMHRYMMYRKAKVYAGALYRDIKCFRSKKVHRLQDGGFMGVRGDLGAVGSEAAQEVERKRRVVDSISKISEYTKRMRAHQIMEEMTTELRVLLSVPIFLYLVHPVFPDSTFPIIKRTDVLIFQILVQVMFDFVSNMISLCMEIGIFRIPFEEYKRMSMVDDDFFMKLSITLTCLFTTHGVLYQLSCDTSGC